MTRNVILSLSLLCILSTSLSAQKTKFKSQAIQVAKVHLPNYYSEPADRTYEIEVTGTYSGDVTNNGKLVGFEEQQDNPNLKVKFNIGKFSVTDKPEVKSGKKEEKDKDGKVTKSYTNYWVEGSTKMTGYVNILALNKPVHISNASDAPQIEEKEDVDNSFISDADVAEGQNSSPQTSGDENYTSVYKWNTTVSNNYKTPIFTSKSKAIEDYNDRLKFEMQDDKANFAQQIYKELVAGVNYQFAYKPFKEQFYMKTIKNDDNPDAQKWNEAVEATQLLFNTTAYNKPIDDLREKFKPIIGYFQEVADKYDASDRKEVKVKQAALQNLYHILYNLDEHVELMALANKYLDVKKLDRSAKRSLMKSEDQLKLLTFNQMSSAHLDNSDSADEDYDVVEEKEEDDGEDE